MVLCKNRNQYLLLDEKKINEQIARRPKCWGMTKNKWTHKTEEQKEKMSQNQKITQAIQHTVLCIHLKQHATDDKMSPNRG